MGILSGLLSFLKRRGGRGGVPAVRRSVFRGWWCVRIGIFLPRKGETSVLLAWATSYAMRNNSQLFRVENEDVAVLLSCVILFGVHFRAGRLSSRTDVRTDVRTDKGVVCVLLGVTTFILIDTRKVLLIYTKIAWF